MRGWGGGEGWGGGNGERGVLEDFEEELHGFEGEQRGSVVANRLPREEYKKLTANEGVGGEGEDGEGGMGRGVCRRILRRNYMVLKENNEDQLSPTDYQGRTIKN